MNKKKRRKKQ